MRSWVEIDLSAFEHNFLALKQLLKPQMEIMQIVKADAYGHGAAEIAALAQKCGATCLGVANADEGSLLRLQGFKCPILILSPSLDSEIPLLIRNKLTPSISDWDFAGKLEELATFPIPVHLNIDTGMGRSGVRLEEAFALYRFLAESRNLTVEGIFTHFAASENDREYTRLQISRFQEFLQTLPVMPRYIHTANSSTLVSGIEVFGNLVRLGALTYGFYTDETQKEKITLIPVMNFKSRISQLKTAEKGDYIGYNRTWCCPQKTRYALIPVGYADGYDFLLSNKSNVLIANQMAPVLGKISMDMIAVDVTAIEEMEKGMEVALLGNYDDLQPDKVASLYNGSPYELLCQMGRRAQRFFYLKKELVASAPRLRREFVSSDYDAGKLNRIIEAAIAQRLQSSEIADFVTEDLIKNIFSDRDKQIYYRHDFQHKITFSNAETAGKEDYYTVQTELKYRKVLTSSQFIIACARDEKQLADYFLKANVEYRWLLDSFLPLSQETFRVEKVMVNNIQLETKYVQAEKCLEIHCSNPALTGLEESEADFLITTTTYYPRSYHQLSVFITDITCGYGIEFHFPANLQMESVIPIFSGRNKFPVLEKLPRKITASSRDWVFPLSGIVFVYTDKI